MLASPVCTGAAPRLPVLKARQPFRLQSLTSRKGQSSAKASESCCFRSRHGSASPVCQTSASDSFENKHTQSTADSILEKAVSFSWAPLAVALPVYLGHGGGDGSGSGGGGGGGDGPGSGGSGQDGSNARNVIADMAEDDDEEEEDDEEDEYEEDDDQEDEEDDEEEEKRAATTVSRRQRETEEEEDDDHEYMTPEGGFVCDDVVADGLPKGPGIPTEDELFASLRCQPNFPCTRAELSEDLKTLLQTGLFDNVDVKVKPMKKGKSQVRFVFREKVWPEMQSFRVAASGGKGELLIPKEEVAKVLKQKTLGPTGMKGLAAIKNIVEKWYHDHGFVFAYIRDFEGMDSGRITANIVEGKVNRVNVVYVDDNGNPKKTGGETPVEVVDRELPFQEGQLYNTDDGRKALRDIFALNLFENVQVMPKPNQRDDSKVDVDVMVKERPMKTADVDLAWGLAPNSNGIPLPADKVPGGSLTFENRNLGKKGNQFSASVTAENFLEPNDDIGFKVDYRQPYVRGTHDKLKTALEGTAFNNRKTSGVFHASGDDVPVVWVDRAGAKIGFHETHSRSSKANYGLVIEEVTTRDEQGQIVTSGRKMLPSGNAAQDGPPTTHSSKGKDRVAFLQGNVTRDATHYVNGTPVGARDQFTVEQSLGLGIMPFFNKHSISLTRFIQILPKKFHKAGSKAPPPIVVLHARYAGCLGDLASYDLFTLGGPYSVRGYNVGELASARRVFEGAVEVRVPVPKLNTHAYAFLEHGTDLGSSKDVVGNPTEYFRKAGSGSSAGVGLKLAAVRTECIWDGNTRRRAFWAHFGERF